MLAKSPRVAHGGQAGLAASWQALNYPVLPRYDVALHQHGQLLALLRKAGAEIHELPAAEGTGPDSIYTHDPVIVTSRGAIGCRMGKAARDAEPAAALRWLETIDIPTLGHIVAPGLLEGGDVVWLDPRTVAIGEGYRTNAAGIRQFRDLLGDLIDEVISVPLPHWTGPADCLHLMSMISPVAADLAMVYSRLLPVPFRQLLIAGHYAQTALDPQGTIQLIRAKDKNKDQSYVLHILNHELLAHTLFPVGGYLKGEVRDIAFRFGLPAAQRRDSQDLCFLAGGDYRDFLVRNSDLPEKSGPILNHDDEVLGQHRGLASYTIGQRKGLAISHPFPLYVLEKDYQRNALIVGTYEQLGSQELFAYRVNWISGTPPAQPFLAQVKIRYRANDIPGEIIPLDGQRIQIKFTTPVRDITPGQAAVFYQEDVCLGGGIIQ